MSDQSNEQAPREDVVDEVLSDDVVESDHDGDKLTPERVGEMAVKFATETAYAAAGVANLIAEKTREFMEQQRKQLAERTPDGVDPNFKQFVDGMPDQVKTFLDEVTKSYHDMAERGRVAVSDFQQQVQTRTERSNESPFDLREDAEFDADPESVVAPADIADVDDEIVDAQFLGETPSTGPSWPGESHEEHRD